MTDPIRPQLETLRELAGRLNEVSDSAGQVVQTVEVYLNEVCHLGVPCCVPIVIDEDEDGTYTGDYLCYQRFGDKFRLLVKEVEDFQAVGGDCKETHTPWANCRRDTKLAAFEKLPALLAKLIEKVQATINQVSGSMEAVQDLLPPPSNGKPPGRLPAADKPPVRSGPAPLPRRPAPSPRRPTPPPPAADEDDDICPF